MKVLKRLLIFLLVLALVICIGIYFIFYFIISDTHEPYMDYIEKYSEENKLDPKLVTAIIKTESSFNPKARSHADARGLMQIVPETGKWIAGRLGEDFSEEMLEDPETNIRYGTYFFKYLFDRYKSIDYAIISYNAGLGNVDSWIKKGILTGDTSDYENIPIDEARGYISKVKNQYRLNQKIYDVYYKDKNSSKFLKAFNLIKALI